MFTLHPKPYQLTKTILRGLHDECGRLQVLLNKCLKTEFIHSQSLCVHCVSIKEFESNLSAVFDDLKEKIGNRGVLRVEFLEDSGGHSGMFRLTVLSKEVSQ